MGSFTAKAASPSCCLQPHWGDFYFEYWRGEVVYYKLIAGCTNDPVPASVTRGREISPHSAEELLHLNKESKVKNSACYVFMFPIYPSSKTILAQALTTQLFMLAIFSSMNEDVSVF